jgi:hypothetical protein
MIMATPSNPGTDRPFADGASAAPSLIGLALVLEGIRVLAALGLEGVGVIAYRIYRSGPNIVTEQ